MRLTGTALDAGQRLVEGFFGLSVVPAERWRPYRDAWDRPDKEALGLTSFVSDLARLHHSQVAQIALHSRLIYFAVPKAANSYMRRWMNTLEARTLWGLDLSIEPGETHSPEFQFCETLAQIPSGYRAHLERANLRSFTVVRDPIERALSAYLDKRNDPIDGKVARKLPRSAWRDFDSFVKALAKRDRLYSDGHWAPQAWILAPVLARTERILRVENLERDLANLEAQWELPRVRALGDYPYGQRRAADLVSKEVSPRTASLLAELYREDFELFSYAPPK